MNNTIDLFVPGRICLFGEHSDWAGGHRRVNANLEKGYAIIVGTNQGVYAKVSAHEDSLHLTANDTAGRKIGPYHLPMSTDALMAEAQSGSFWSYIAGVAHYVQQKYKVKGLVIDNFKTDLPLKKGLSSSAAICVLVARAFNQVYNLNLSTIDEMEIAYQGEILTSSRCGRMDQGCAFGNKPILMTFDADKLAVTPLTVGEPLYMVIIDLRGKKDTKKILAALHNSYPFPENNHDRDVQALLGKKNREIIVSAISLIEHGEVKKVGKLMTTAQGMFDTYAAPLCPDELTSPLLHKVLQFPSLQKHIWGGKGVGSQGDGSAQLVARSLEDQKECISILNTELKMSAISLTIEKS